MSVLIVFIQKAIVQGICILYGALGEIMTEKSGNLNLGIPGIMYMGGISGLMGAFLYEKDNPDPNALVGVLISFLCAFACAAIGGLIYSILTITLRVNQNVTGLALTIFGTGFGNFFGGSISKLAGGVGQISVKVTGSAYTAKIPGLSKIPVIGGILFNYGFLTYLCIIIAVLLSFFLFKTRAGLNLRAIGENPGTADAAGINVIKYKYLSTCIGAGLAGLGGLYFVMIWVAVTSVSAQEAKKWTLDDCIDYALEKNIQLQQDKISLEESSVDVKTAKAALFPSLSFSTGQNVTNRPYQETSNTVSGMEIISSDSKTTYNGNYGLNAQWTLWNGNKRLNAIKQKKTSQQIAGLTVAETENSLQEQIAQIFIQILYADESVKINQNTLQVSQATYDRGKELFHKGSISKADLAQLESQVGSDKYQLVISESSLRDYKLQLKQLLELDGTEEMDLVLPELADEHVLQPLPAQEDVYQQALASRPEIQSSKLSIENSKLDISVAKAGYLPTISLSASTGSMTNSASDNSWSKQMKYGWNNMIGLNINIPIFDNRQNKSAVQKARLQYDSSLLDLINKQKELYKNIESLWLDATNAQEQYAAAESKLKSSQASYEMVSEQFNLGMKNTVELLTEKNNLLSAQQQRIQAKYMAILDRTLLNFYAGQDIKL